LPGKRLSEVLIFKNVIVYQVTVRDFEDSLFAFITRGSMPDLSLVALNRKGMVREAAGMSKIVQFLYGSEQERIIHFIHNIL
jgi:hypothetical protein